MAWCERTEGVIAPLTRVLVRSGLVRPARCDSSQYLGQLGLLFGG